MITRDTIDAYVRTFPVGLQLRTFIEVWYDPLLRGLYQNWSDNHPLAGKRIRLAVSFAHVTFRGNPSRISMLRCGPIEIWGDSWRIIGYHARGKIYRIAPEKIDWSRLSVQNKRKGAA